MLLSKLSFDRALLEKEMHKAKIYVSLQEYLELKRWAEGYLIGDEKISPMDAASTTDYLTTNTGSKSSRNTY